MNKQGTEEVQICSSDEKEAEENEDIKGQFCQENRGQFQYQK